MVKKHRCRQTLCLPILAAFLFMASALISVSMVSGVVGTGEAHAVDFLHALVKSYLTQSAAGGAKTSDGDGSSPDAGVAAVSKAPEKSPVHEVEPDVAPAGGEEGKTTTGNCPGPKLSM